MLEANNEPKNLIFITIHFADALKTIDDAFNKTKRLLFPIFRKLGGKKWQQYIKGIAAIEHGKFNNLHPHLVVNTTKFSTFDLVLKLIILRRKYNFAFDVQNKPDDPIENYQPFLDHILLQELKTEKDLDNVLHYITKEIRFNGNKAESHKISTLYLMSNRQS